VEIYLLHSAYLAKALRLIARIRQRSTVSFREFGKGAQKNQIGFFFINFLYILKRNFTKKQSVCEQLDPRPTYQAHPEPNYSAADAAKIL
jgi:hypothetical protein